MNHAEARSKLINNHAASCQAALKEEQNAAAEHLLLRGMPVLSLVVWSTCTADSKRLIDHT